MPTLISLAANPQSAMTLSFVQDDALAFHFATNTEPADHARFIRDYAAKCHVAVIDDPDGRDIFSVFREERAFFVKQTDEPICSRRLKFDRLFAQAQKHAPCAVVFPFTAQDYRLAQRMVALFAPISGVTVRFPLIERRITAEDCRRRVAEEWGIPLPAMTAWLGEAVCYPCVRGTLAYYGELWQRSPDVVTRLAALECEIGQTILDEGSLEEMFPRGLYAANTRPASKRLLWTPCLCK